MGTGVTLYGFERLRAEPDGCAAWLTGDVADLWGVGVDVAAHDDRLTVMAVHFAPPPDLPGYPAEDVRLAVANDGRIVAIPIGAAGRRWKHRYPQLSLREIAALPAGRRIAWEHLFGGLCLWYPDDPRYLRWCWDDGIGAYVRIVQRHVWSEEYWRRHDHWPAEDVPHGKRLDGAPHPIVTPNLRSPR